MVSCAWVLRASAYRRATAPTRRFRREELAAAAAWRRNRLAGSGEGRECFVDGGVAADERDGLSDRGVAREHGDRDRRDVVTTDLAALQLVPDRDATGAGVEGEAARAEDCPVERGLAQVVIGGRLRLRVSEERVRRVYAVVGARAQIRHHQVPLHTGGCCGIHRA